MRPPGTNPGCAASPATSGSEPSGAGAQSDYDCAICQRRVSMRFVYTPGKPWTPVRPLCLSCERDYSRGVGKPLGGSFRDRRNVTIGLALAEGLRCEAAHLSWPEYREFAHV